MPSPKNRALEPQPDTDQPRIALLDELDPKSRTVLQSWMDKYVAKKAQIDDLNAECESIKLDRIEPLRLRLGLTKIDSDEWYIARRPGKLAVDKEKVRRYLFQKGVALKLITEAFDIATSKGKPFTEIKRKGQKEKE